MLAVLASSISTCDKSRAARQFDCPAASSLRRNPLQYNGLLKNRITGGC
jgi:hypothetical protein